jgi:hypothetical protein
VDNWYGLIKMKMLNYLKEQRVLTFLRFCICFFIFTLSISGIMIAAKPVHAIGINADPGATITVNECEPFTIQFTATGTACTPPPEPFFWFWPALPSYVDFDTNTGLLTGCPQVGDASSAFFVGVSEFSPPMCGPFDSPPILVTINVDPLEPSCDMVIEPTFYPVAWEGLPFSMDLSVTGGIGPFLWSTTGLPSGLSVTDNATGTISGIPDPGTCGIYTVTATVSDTGTCCCADVNRDFILIVDCWANYPIVFYYSTGCDFNVEIGSGLSQGFTNVLIDGIHEATLGGTQTQGFTSIPCESHLVMVDQMIPGSNSNSRYSVIGSNVKVVTDIDNYAYFDYTQEVRIDTATSPGGITQPPGAGFYPVGNYFSSTAVGAVATDIQQGIKYVFREWQLPDGSKSPGKDLSFIVNQAGTATAEYDTFYLLTLKSDYPSIEEQSWERKGETATWNLSLHSVPMESGFWAFLGGTISPLNSSGSQLITEPTTIEIIWQANYIVPIIAIVVILLIIGGIIYLVYWLRSRTPQPVTKPPARTRVKKATSKTGKSTTRKRTAK